MKLLLLPLSLFSLSFASCRHERDDSVSHEEESAQTELMLTVARASHLAASLRSGHADDFRRQLLIDNLFRIYLIDPGFFDNDTPKINISEDLHDKFSDPLIWMNFLDQGSTLLNKGEFVFIVEPTNRLMIDAVRINRQVYSDFDSRSDYLEIVGEFRSLMERRSDQ
jgi:hypothetical protein